MVNPVPAPARAQALAQLTRLYPFVSGPIRFAHHPLLSRLVGPLDCDVWAQAPGGRMVVPAADHVGRTVFLFGDFDAKISHIIRQTLRPGDTAMDIGAKLGVVTTLMADVIGADGRVIAFEPNPRVLDYLKLTLEDLTLKNVELHEALVGESEREITLHTPPASSTKRTCLQEEGATHEPYEVCVKPLSAVIDDNAHIRLMKIDVEGFEQEILSGARQKLEANLIDMVVFEEHESLQPGFTPPTIQTMQDCGYDVFAIGRGLFAPVLISLERARAIRPIFDYIGIARSEEGTALKSKLGL